MLRPVTVLSIVIVGIIIAAGLFLALAFIRSRPDAPAGTFTTLIGNEQITIRMNPEREVRILSEQELAPADGQPQDGDNGDGDGQQPEAGATAVPEPSPTPTPEPTATPAPKMIIFVNHTVAGDDTLYRLTQKFNTTIALLAEHGIAQDHLVSGATISIPVANPAYCPNRTAYIVREGDTAFSISRRFNTTVQDLRAINGLDDKATVYAARVLCVP